jgi:PPOX class probable F420-dependent enzyme
MLLVEVCQAVHGRSSGIVGLAPMNDVFDAPARRSPQFRAMLIATDAMDANERTPAGMFSDDERALLDLPAFASLATLLPDGTPLLTVMWYRQEGDTLQMITPAASRKARNMAKDGRAAIVVTDPDNGYAYVEMRGRIELSNDPDANREALRAIATRYIGAERAEPYVSGRDMSQRVLITFRPEHVHGHFERKP